LTPSMFPGISRLVIQVTPNNQKVIYQQYKRSIICNS